MGRARGVVAACSGISGDLNATAGTDTITGTINGWSLYITSGTTKSPGLVPFGIDLTSLTASCMVSGGCTGANDLHIIYSDAYFNVPVAAGGFLTSYSDTQNGTGTTSQSAYFDQFKSPLCRNKLDRYGWSLLRYQFRFRRWRRHSCRTQLFADSGHHV